MFTSSEHQEDDSDGFQHKRYLRDFKWRVGTRGCQWLQYLGSYVSSTERDLKVRKALARSALHSAKRVWRSDLDDNLKRQLFVVTVESVLLYGAEEWTLTVQQEKSLDGAYTGMLYGQL